MIVMVLVLAFWLTAIFLADRSQVLASGQSWRSSERQGVTGNAWAGGSVAGEQAAEVPGEAAHEPIGVQGPTGVPGPTGVHGRHARPGGEEPVPAGDSPTRADVPAQSTGRVGVPSQRTEPAQPTESTPPVESAQPTGRHAMPAQRTGDADRAERSFAGPPAPREGEAESQHPSRWRWLLTRGHR